VERKKSNIRHNRANGPERRGVPLCWSPTPSSTLGTIPRRPRCQEGVKARQHVINVGLRCPATALTDRVIENIAAGLVALALVAYLVYALVKPERF
jgi:K+-transporting ATPase KdpF subunit